MVVTPDFIPNEDRISPPRDAMFSMQMLGTPAGDAYTFSELDRMFRNAGFARNEMREFSPVPAAPRRFLQIALTNKLVFENLKHRPVRTLLGVVAISIQVTMVLTLVGLSDGMLNEQASRARGVGADILIRPPGSAIIASGGQMLAQDHSGRDRQSSRTSQAATGTLIFGTDLFNYITGVDLDDVQSTQRRLPIRAAADRSSTPDDVMVDEVYAAQHKLHVGDSINNSNHVVARVGNLRARDAGAHGGAARHAAGPHGQYRKGQHGLREGGRSREHPRRDLGAIGQAENVQGLFDGRLHESLLRRPIFPCSPSSSGWWWAWACWSDSWWSFSRCTRRCWSARARSAC